MFKRYEMSQITRMTHLVQDNIPLRSIISQRQISDAIVQWKENKIIFQKLAKSFRVLRSATAAINCYTAQGIQTHAGSKSPRHFAALPQGKMERLSTKPSQSLEILTTRPILPTSLFLFPALVVAVLVYSNYATLTTVSQINLNIYALSYHWNS